MQTYNDLKSKLLNEDFDNPQAERAASRAYGSFKMPEVHGIVDGEFEFEDGTVIDDTADLNKLVAMNIADEFGATEIQSFTAKHFQPRSRGKVTITPLALSLYVEGARTNERDVLRAVEDALKKMDRSTDWKVLNGGGSYYGREGDYESFGQTLVIIYPAF